MNPSTRTAATALTVAAVLLVLIGLFITVPPRGGADHALVVTASCGKDDCQSAVDLNPAAFITYPGEDLSEFAGHNGGPAVSILDYQVGDTVRVLGTGAGLYRITRTIDVPIGTSTADVPGGLAFQTCIDDHSMRLAYAEPIGDVGH